MTRVKDIVDFIYEVLPKTANIFVRKLAIHREKIFTYIPLYSVEHIIIVNMLYNIIENI